jgi:hypothetical protein
MTQPIVKIRRVASDIRMRGPRHLEPLRSCQNILSSIGINHVTRQGKVPRRDSNCKLQALRDTYALQAVGLSVSELTVGDAEIALPCRECES